MNRLYLLIICFVLLSFTEMPSNTKAVSALSKFNIDVIAPASGTSTEELENLMLLKLNLNLPINCLDLRKNKVLFCAHSQEIRLKCLKEALLKNNNNIIWSLRGGYGSAQVIPYLFDLNKPAKEKIVIGYSDITALHLFLSQEWGWKSIHGAMLTELLKPEKNSNNFLKIADLINGKIQTTSIDDLTPLNSIAKHKGYINGLLTGGNLTIVQTSIGTKWQIKAQNKIIFLEDVGVKPYQIDRALTHLQQASIFQEASAIIFGSFGEDDELTLQTLENFAQIIKVPVYKTSNFGHNNNNYPLIYNSESRIIHEAAKFKLVMKM